MLHAPEWLCDWYWGMGYLGNANWHYHLSSYQDKTHHLNLSNGRCKFITERRNLCMRDCLLEDYELNKGLEEENLWVFCELIETAYALKEAAEVLGRGGSHMTTNPCRDIIKNEDEVKRINQNVLPAIFNKINKLF